MKICVWMNMPSHHQSSFFEALISCGTDLQVRYFGRVSEYRKRLGWDSSPRLNSFEAYVDPELPIGVALDTVGDWRERVHVVIGYGWSFSRGLVYKLCKSRARWVHWSESAMPGVRWWRSAPLKYLYAWCVNRYALGAFAISDLAVADFQRWGIQAGKIALLPYSIPKPEGAPAVALARVLFQERKQTFLYVGELRRQKGFDVLIRAFAQALKSPPAREKWILALVGLDNSKGECSELINVLGLESAVLQLGPVSYRDVGSYMRAADVIVLPSRFDGWGAVISEGASLGKALIASSMVGAAHHLVIPGKNGFRAVSGDVDSFAECLRRYMADPNLADVHGHQSLSIFDEYTPKKNAARFLTALSKWLAGQEGKCNSES